MDGRKDAEALLAHTGWMRSLASSLVRDPLGADDLVQDAFVAVLERRRGAATNLRAWLAGVLRNLARAEFRAARRRRRREEVAARREAMPSASDIVERADLHRRLVEAILRLEEPYVSAVLLRYFDGLKPADIARSKRVPESTVRTWLSRGIEKLRRSLEPPDAEGRQAWRSGLMSLAGLKQAGSMSAGSAASAGRTAHGLALGGTIVKIKVALVSSILVCAALAGIAWISRPHFGPGAGQGADRLRAPDDLGRPDLPMERDEAARERDRLLGRIAELEEKLRAKEGHGGGTEAAEGEKGEDLPPDIQGALESWKTLLVDPERLWDQLHSDGELETMLEFTATVGTLMPWKLANEDLTAAERASCERLLDLNGFREGYVKFALGDFAAAAKALEDHIERLDAKEAELAEAGRTLDKAAEIYREFRSKDVLRFLRERAGRPPRAELDLGDGWVTEKRLLVSESRGKVVGVVFRGLGDTRGGSFLQGLHRNLATKSDMEIVTLSYFKGDETLEGAREKLKEDLARLDYGGPAGIDPGQSLFRGWQAAMGSATFMIVDREGRLAWYMPDPRGIDVTFATRLMDRIAGRR